MPIQTTAVDAASNILILNAAKEKLLNTM